VVPLTGPWNPEPYLDVLATSPCRINDEGYAMPLQPSPRRSHAAHSVRPLGQTRDRALSARRYLDLGRRPRLGDLPARRPPYIEAAATAAAFLFLAYLILGGA
jgi:hypothetical protein